MDFLQQVWNTYLYEPLLNFLIFLYNTAAEKNLGWAVVLLTLSLRVALLPLTIISERNKLRYEELKSKIREIKKQYNQDAVAARTRIRGMLQKYKVSPWAKTLLLAIQALVLVLLYQVFIAGIRGQRLTAVLYPSVDYPGKINTIFYGFDIGARNIWWALGIGLVLFIEIYLEQRGEKRSRADLYYWILFPLGSFLILWTLPMVKSIFILTTLAFSYTIGTARRVFFSPKSD